ncbi:beta-propeller domain-containing protein [Adlercreutzia equolifaciens]|uniref:beta-propeller domain-containing protein n=1 Tax=Adlercreutzia equolifaciens TaxID=446660 RepID=UPI0023AE9810|nr:beta-propeller domain-containing protein [Adlercreutzia equolifaciens]MDE8703062.1 beta-propeller domain-containing protein [Adlercreutzia equolifaciens]
MDAHEKKTLEALARAAESIGVPASVAPAAIEARLQTLETEEATARVLRPKRRRWVPALAAAACLALVAGLGVMAVAAGGVTTPSLSSLTTVADPAEDSGAEEDDGPLDASVVRAVPVAGSYEELYQRLQGAGERPQGDELSITEALEAGDAAAADASSSAQVSSAFSTTNVRTAGVDEADVVKTDGSRLYALQDNGNRIVIVETRDGAMELVGSMKPEDGTWCELFLEGERLYAIAETYPEVDNLPGVPMVVNPRTVVTTYDVSDPSSPQVVAAMQQEGYYHSARLTGGFLYLFTGFMADPAVSAEQTEGYVPSVNGETLAHGDIYLPNETTSPDCLVISAVDTKDPSVTTDQKAVLCNVDDVYVGSQSIYVYGPQELEDDEVVTTVEDDAGEETGGAAADGADGNQNSSTGDDADNMADDYVVAPSSQASSYKSDQTVICKLAYQEGSIEAVGETIVTGVIDDSFSIDEYEGTTRVLTTLYQKGEFLPVSNRVSVLDEQLQLIGEVKDLAPGERIYAARLMGDVGFFVTYRDVDPLFTVDFSDPRHPRIAGQLKVPGFSEYLHPFGEGRLLGIGMTTEPGSSVTTGFKLSMFDTSDPANVREVASYALEGTFWGAVLSDYRAAFVDAERGLVGFSIEGSDDCYLLFSYSDKRGFREELAERQARWGYQSARGVRIGEIFYVVAEDQATSYHLKGYREIESVAL